jgi:hypothetical protein
MVLPGGAPSLLQGMDDAPCRPTRVFGQLSMLRSGPTPQAERLIAARPRLGELFARVDAATAVREPARAAG